MTIKTQIRGMTLGVILLGLLSCQSNPVSDSPITIAQEHLIVDTHIDVPYRLEEKWDDVSVKTEGNFDYPKAIEGGLNVLFMSIYTPAVLNESNQPFKLAEKLIDTVEDIAKKNPSKFTMVYNSNEALKTLQTKQVGFALGMENGSPIEGDLANLTHFFNRGVRYITLAHSLSNHISDSSYDENRPNKGLSPFGVSVVKEMNRLGIMVDVSHISDDAFYQVMEHSSAPVIASHSSARHFTPGFERNMSDDMIRLLAKNNGVIMINYGSSFVTQEANQWGKKRNKSYEEYLIKHNLTATDKNKKSFRSEWSKSNPYPYATLDNVLDHIDHVVKLVGIDYVGIGSDYDGVGDSLPTDLKDAASYPNLVDGLLKRGYTKGNIQKILSGNIMRVWKKVEEVSSR